MAIATPKKLGAQTLTTSVVTVGSAIAAGKQFILQEIVLCNYTATDRKVSVYVGSTATPADSELILKDYVVPAYSFLNPGFCIVMAEGEKVSATTDGALAVNIRVSGSEIA